MEYHLECILYITDYKHFTVMKNKCLNFLLALFVTVSVRAQVTSVDYILEYNCATNLYEVKLKVLEGSATTIAERAQFNAQITMVLPTGTNFEITELVNPIKNNQNMDGTEPTTWLIGNPLVSPVEDPMHDFYPISPIISTASFYNTLETNDEPILFICKIGNSTEYNPEYRFYNNDTDVKFTTPGSGNYSNGFTMGGPIQLYQGNDYKSCTTDINEEEIIQMEVYPNPFSEQIKILLIQHAELISIIDITGKIMYYEKNKNAGLININTSSFPSGPYMINIQSKNANQIRRMIKK